MTTQSRVRSLARRAVRQIFFVLFGIAGALLWPLRATQTATAGRPVGRILVIRLDLLGDVLLSMPAVEALRRAYPEARLMMLTLPYTAPLALLFPFVDEVLAVDTNRIRSLRGALDPATWRQYWNVYRLLRRERIDLCVSLCGRMASFWALLSGARRTVGYAGEAYPFVLTEAVKGGRHVERMHEVEYAGRLSRQAGAPEVASHLDLPVPPAAARRVEELLLERGISPADRVAMIHPGAINGSAKRWPARNWAVFAGETAARTGARIVVTGAPSERPLAQQVVSQAPSSVVSLAGATTIEELVALVARADLVATGDSAPLHLAVALRRPLLAVHGPTDPTISGPYRPVAPTYVHRRDLACSPCYTMAASAECPLGDPICMRLVSVEQMVSSAIALLLPREDQFLVAQQDALQDAE